MGINSIRKAIVAIIMGTLYIANSVWGVDLGLNEEVVSALLGIITPALVWWIPNK